MKSIKTPLSQADKNLISWCARRIKEIGVKNGYYAKKLKLLYGIQTKY